MPLLLLRQQLGRAQQDLTAARDGAAALALPLQPRFASTAGVGASVTPQERLCSMAEHLTALLLILDSIMLLLPEEMGDVAAPTEMT